MTPDVSIVMPVYARYDILPDVLKGIANQSMFTKIELVIVDDSKIPINSLPNINDIFKEFRWVQYRHRKNGCLRTAWEEGLDMANGKYVLTHASDFFPSPAYVEILYRHLESNTCDGIQGVYPYLPYGYGPRHLHDAWWKFIMDEPFMLRILNSYFFQLYYSEHEDRNGNAPLLQIPFFAGGKMAKRDVLKKIGYPEILTDKCFGEDYVVGMEMVIDGYKIACALDAVCWHLASKVTTRVNNLSLLDRFPSGLSKNHRRIEKIYAPLIGELIKYNELPGSIFFPACPCNGCKFGDNLRLQKYTRYWLYEENRDSIRFVSPKWRDVHD